MKSHQLTISSHSSENDLRELNRFALELSNLSFKDDLEVFIAKEVKQITGAKLSIFNEYNPVARTVTPKHIELESKLLKKASKLLGTRLQNLHSEVSEDMYQEMTNNLIGVRKTLHEVSFGAIPSGVGETVQAILNVNRFIGMAYLIEGELYGTGVLAFSEKQPDPPKEILENIIHLASVSLRRKKAELALRESEEKFRSIMENSPDAIFIANQKGQYVYSNKAASALLGYTSEELKTMSFTDIRATKNKEDGLDYFQQTLTEGKGFYEFELRKKDGKIISTDLNSIILPNGLVYGSCRDITSRKKTEQELIQLNADKDRLIEILGHDLKSPFNHILGFSELLAKNIHKYDIDKIEDLAKHLYKSAQNFNDLLNDLLNWVIAQQGKIPFLPERLNLNNVCKNVLKALHSSANEKNIKINCLAEEAMNVFADAELLKIILRNLLTNAIKFTNSGGTITIDATQNSENVSISVSDNGVGIEANDIKKLFDVSKAFSTKGTSGESGTGLGLLLCKEFVEKHGGKIWVESEVANPAAGTQGGSVFHFTLPV